MTSRYDREKERAKECKKKQKKKKESKSLCVGRENKTITKK